MKPIKLSICIGSLHSRIQKLHELQVALATQERLDEVEILIAADDGYEAIGQKRNRLVHASIGQYVCHIDDDDLVHADYTKLILEAIDRNPGVHAIAIRGWRTEPNQRVGDHVEFDYRLGEDINGTWDRSKLVPCLWRSPGHLCPVRSDIVKHVPFIAQRAAEDLIWVQHASAHLSSCVRAAEFPLYHYRWDPKKPPGT